VSSYLRRPAVAGLILASFFLLTLPAAAYLLLAGHGDPVGRYRLIQALRWFGLTHFLITFSIYFRGEDLRYFLSSRNGPVIYLFVPFLLFTLVTGNNLLGLDARFETYGFVYMLLFAAADFFHVNRQTFGVLELLKKSCDHAFPAWTRKTVNFLLLLGTGLELFTLARGGAFRPSSGVTLALAMGFVLFAACAAAFVSVAAKHGSARALVPLAYLSVQLVSIGLVIYRSELYIAALAVHYAEYHVLMVPRCFELRRDGTFRVDRLWSRLTANRWLFYGGLAVLCAWIPFFPRLVPEVIVRANPGNLSTLFVPWMTGIFAWHYFVEAFIWRFREPHYRETLSPLYFGSGAERIHSPSNLATL
jgi:hypothetical protein